MIKITVKSGNQSKEYSFSKDLITFGREKDNDIILDNPAVSSKHFKIYRENYHYYLEDLKSTNGTFIESHKIEKIEIKNNTEIRVINYKIIFNITKPEKQKAKLKVIEFPAGDITEFSLEKKSTFIGIEGKADIPVKPKNIYSVISDISASVSLRNNKFYLIPINEEIVILNSETIRKITELKNGDIIQIGLTKFSFEITG